MRSVFATSSRRFSKGSFQRTSPALPNASTLDLSRKLKISPTPRAKKDRRPGIGPPTSQGGDIEAPKLHPDRFFRTRSDLDDDDRTWAWRRGAFPICAQVPGELISLFSRRWAPSNRPFKLRILCSGPPPRLQGSPHVHAYALGFFGVFPVAVLRQYVRSRLDRGIYNRGVRTHLFARVRPADG